MLNDLISAYGDRFLVAALGVSLALLCLFIVLWILRNRAPSPFVRGGRNRQPRLQVLDAAAVDTRRRIVLIRRDNIEHLVMIGGPTDIVIESGIGDERAYLNAQTVLPHATGEQQELPKPAQTAALAASSAPAQAEPMPVAPAAAIEPPARRTATPEPMRPVAAETPLRSQSPSPSPSIAAERRPQPAPVRPAEPVEQRQPQREALPLATAATMAAVPVATASPVVEAPRPSTPPTTVTPASVTPPVEPSSPPAVPPTQPSVRLEPMVVASAEPVTNAALPQAGASDQGPAVVPAVQAESTAGTPPIEPMRRQPVEPVMTEVPKPISFHEVRQDRAEPQVVLPPVIDAPVAEDLLDAARQRVLAPAQTPVQTRLVEPHQVEPVIERQPPIAANEPAPRDMSDFERVLEEEMALHLSADPAPKPATQLPQILPDTRADRPRPPVTAVLPDVARSNDTQTPPSQQGQEPNLQNEIARIFGEMSASRNP